MFQCETVREVVHAWALGFSWQLLLPSTANIILFWFSFVSFNVALFSLSHSYVWLWNILVIVRIAVINFAGWSNLSFLSGRHVFWRPRPQLASQDKSHACIMRFKSNEVSYCFISKEKQLFFCNWYNIKERSIFHKHMILCFYWIRTADSKECFRVLLNWGE